MYRQGGPGSRAERAEIGRSGRGSGLPIAARLRDNGRTGPLWPGKREEVRRLKIRKVKLVVRIFGCTLKLTIG